MPDETDDQARESVAVQVVNSSRTFWIGVWLLAIWSVSFMAEVFELRPHFPGVKGTLIDWGPLLAGLAVSAPGSLARLGSFISRVREKK